MMWSLKKIQEFEVEAESIEIFNKSKYALDYIGVNFEREDVQWAIMNCNYGLEDAFRATISYWYWKQQNNQKFEYPNAFLIEAIAKNWQPYQWKAEYLKNPNFKSPYLRWWDEAGKRWGEERRNAWVADVGEDENGNERVLFRSGDRLSWRIVNTWGWQRVSEYARDVNSDF
ncbi:MAG: hypothetical protein ACFBSE_06310 [Prochloraceae cyanobacterium]